jgi:hypothetical protein
MDGWMDLGGECKKCKKKRGKEGGRLGGMCV